VLAKFSKIKASILLMNGNSVEEEEGTATVTGGREKRSYRWKDHQNNFFSFFRFPLPLSLSGLRTGGEA
jgi:hypothetical protein